MDLPGITADLEALARVGIGSLIVFAEHRPGMKTGNVKMFSAEYGAGIRHLLREAERLGLEVSLFNCAGSATAGGPWNAPEHSMKQFVWSEALVTGGGTKTLKLKQPFTVGGFYRDIGVTAHPLAAGTIPSDVRTPKITAPKANGKLTDLMDGDILSLLLFRGESSRDPREIRFEYARPLTAGRLFAYANLFRYSHPVHFELEFSEDGQRWKRIASATQTGNNPAVADFAPVTARHFRVWVSTKMDNLWISELELLPPGGRPRSYPQFNDWAEATGRGKEKFGEFHPLLLGKDKPLDTSRAVDLTSCLQKDGTLAWDAPPGEWLVLRTGYTSTGKKNHPAHAEGEGYEVDKLDDGLAQRHMAEGLKRMSGGATNAPSLKYLHVDSWEAGGQSWSENLPENSSGATAMRSSPSCPCSPGNWRGTRKPPAASSMISAAPCRRSSWNRSTAEYNGLPGATA